MYANLRVQVEQTSRIEHPYFHFHSRNWRTAHFWTVQASNFAQQRDADPNWGKLRLLQGQKVNASQQRVAGQHGGDDQSDELAWPKEEDKLSVARAEVSIRGGDWDQD